MPSIFENAGYLAILAVGFGFVVFWHELGHFLAAKWAGVKVEQFAVGFMQAVVSWRKGLGVRFGSSQKEFRGKLEAWLNDTSARNADKTVDRIRGSAAEGWTDGDYGLAAEALGIGETEYRLNWLPLGGYVKMLGQDDLRPNSEADDPRAYNRQTIGKRMVIVSAGVIMNVILAAVLFVILFSIGFKVAPSWVGNVQAGSPAQNAKAENPNDNGLQVGDDVLQIDGRPQYEDWTKAQLNSALSAAGEEIPVVVKRGDRQLTLRVTPVKSGGFVSMGFGPYSDMTAPDAGKDSKEITEKDAPQLLPRSSLLLQPGDSIVAVNGRPVGLRDYATLHQATQQGKQVLLVVQSAGAQPATRPVTFEPTFEHPFGGETFHLLGMVPRMQIESIDKKYSSLKGRAQPGDVVISVGRSDGEPKHFPSFNAFRKTVNDAANANANITLKLWRNGQEVVEKDLPPYEVAKGSYGLGVGAGYDMQEAVVADLLDGKAASGKVPVKAAITKVNDQPVKNWRDVHVALREALAGKEQSGGAVRLSYRAHGMEEERQLDLTVPPADVLAIRQVQYGHGLALKSTIVPRKADGLGMAMSWGVIETRDFILQFYVTLRRMVSGDVSPKNLMGPVGIFQAGTHFASKGSDWLLWFLAMISANLAVVNFLPIPIVDGGLFVFLIAEKIKGRPISQRTQAVAQYLGLALLLGIFLFVTWQDISNFKFRMR